jgi:hypothetical protein
MVGRGGDSEIMGQLGFRSARVLVSSISVLLGSQVSAEWGGGHGGESRREMRPAGEWQSAREEWPAWLDEDDFDRLGREYWRAAMAGPAEEGSDGFRGDEGPALGAGSAGPVLGFGIGEAGELMAPGVSRDGGPASPQVTG